MYTFYNLPGLCLTAFLAITPVQFPVFSIDQAHAQAPAPLEPPNGFIAVESGLQWADLRNLPVHDATGAVIGEVQGVVYDDGTVDMVDALAPVTDAMSTQPKTAMPQPAAPVAGLPEAPQPAFSDRSSPPAATSTNKDAGTASGDDERATEAVPLAKDAASTAVVDKKISDAVIDVGGFLGLGAHRVAVPFDELRPFRKGAELQIFLPWTRSQLEALPQFDPEGPSGKG